MTDPADFYTGLVAELYAPLRSFTLGPGRVRVVHRVVRRARARARLRGRRPAARPARARARRRRGRLVGGHARPAPRVRGRPRAVRDRPPAAHGGPRPAAAVPVDLPGRRHVHPARRRTTLALRALRAIRAHLTDDGTALVPLFVPGADAGGPGRGLPVGGRPTSGATIRVGGRRRGLGRRRPDASDHAALRARDGDRRRSRSTASGCCTGTHRPGFGALAAQAGLVVLDGRRRRRPRRSSPSGSVAPRRRPMPQSRNVSIWAPSSTRRSWSCS